MSNLRFALPLVIAAVLPLLVLAQGTQQPPAPAPNQKAAEEPPTEAEKTLDLAIAQLNELDQVQTQIQQQVEMLGQSFSIVGEYLQAEDNKFRLRLEIQGLPETTGQMAQICDGQNLWDFQRILDESYYSRMDLNRILEQLKDPIYPEAFREQFIQTRLGLSGPVAMLEGLRRSAEFDRQFEGEHDGRPIWVLRGRWTDMTALGLQPMMQAPAYVPSLVEIQIDQETGWPYQILLQGKQPSELAKTPPIDVDPATKRALEENIAQQSQSPSRFRLTYTEVDFEPEISAGAFTFQVPVAERDQLIDNTSTVLATLERQAQMLRAQQQQENSDGGNLLDEGMTIPSLKNQGQPPAQPPSVPSPSQSPFSKPRPPGN